MGNTVGLRSLQEFPGSTPTRSSSASSTTPSGSTQATTTCANMPPRTSHQRRWWDRWPPPASSWPCRLARSVEPISIGSCHQTKVVTRCRLSQRGRWCAIPGIVGATGPTSLFRSGMHIRCHHPWKSHQSAVVARRRRTEAERSRDLAPRNLVPQPPGAADDARSSSKQVRE